MCDADHLSRQLNLPDATPSEVAQTREYEPTYKLPYPLDQFQSLIDMDADELVQPVGGGCGTADCVNAMMTHGRAESLLVNSLTEPEIHPCMTCEELEPAMTWQLLLAAQQADTVIPYFVQQLMGDKSPPAVNPDECSDEFKVLASSSTSASMKRTRAKCPGACYFIRRPGSSHPPPYGRN